MRLFAFLVILVAAAGCVSPEVTPTPPTTPTNGGSSAALPEPINDTKQVQGGFQPITSPAGGACDAPSAQCFTYPFTLNTTATIEVALSWTVALNDFDIHLVSDGETIASDLNPPPGTTASLSESLGPGSYELIVAAATNSQDTYTLSATFSA